MPAPRGNRNALKHGLYAKHFNPDLTPELKRMPADSVLMELYALRMVASQALDHLETVSDPDKKTTAILAAVRALEAAAAAVTRHRLLDGNAPILQDLWDAVRQANLDEGVDVTV